ncbi:hypothetical protein [Streptomyces kanamyceticus]|uniref:ImmA/IrrE family metallo-endopeptidase n=1 Tax=Streptomyces kanamyceticus TaxID=1967 RepID=Q1EQS1_STRKN|nr:hypothetical protein [Streptomyces kanamyceticus]QEU90497.1 hypothetical protein CP970_05840 [Streptomyces kanamyceticus]BAE95449.1 hypothetical protein [Streptomyces kanamyceticus]
MIHYADSQICRALASFPVPEPLTIDSLFAVIQDRYPRPLELWREDPPLAGLRANGLWLTRPEAESDAIWVAPELTGAAAVHTLAHEVGHIALSHKPVVLPAEPEPEPYQFLSADFLAGCLMGRTRSQDGPQDPEHVKVEDQAERFAFALRRKALDRARENQHSGDPLLDRLYKAL